MNMENRDTKILVELFAGAINAQRIMMKFLLTDGKLDQGKLEYAFATYIAEVADGAECVAFQILLNALQPPPVAQKVSIRDLLKVIEGGKGKTPEPDPAAD